MGLNLSSTMKRVSADKCVTVAYHQPQHQPDVDHSQLPIPARYRLICISPAFTCLVDTTHQSGPGDQTKAGCGGLYGFRPATLVKQWAFLCIVAKTNFQRTGSVLSFWVQGHILSRRCLGIKSSVFIADSISYFVQYNVRNNHVSAKHHNPYFASVRNAPKNNLHHHPFDETYTVSYMRSLVPSLWSMGC